MSGKFFSDEEIIEIIDLFKLCLAIKYIHDRKTVHRAPLPMPGNIHLTNKPFEEMIIIIRMLIHIHNLIKYNITMNYIHYQKLIINDIVLLYIYIYSLFIELKKQL